MTMPGTTSMHPAQRAQEPPFATGSKWTSLLFAVLVLVFCCWTLSLPLFPTQDGPMHKYYVHVIASLLSGSHAYGMYLIRHPLPPYAIHYAILLGLTKFLSLDLAEKIFICLIFVLTAYSFRYWRGRSVPAAIGSRSVWFRWCFTGRW